MVDQPSPSTGPGLQVRDVRMTGWQHRFMYLNHRMLQRGSSEAEPLVAHLASLLKLEKGAPSSQWV